MGCKHYFVADRLEALVDEGDSRSSSRAHEHENFRLVSQRHVAIQTPKKSMYWRKVVFSSVEIWWNVGSKNGDTRRWQICHRWLYGLWHRHRIRPFVEVTVILAQGEWSGAKDIGPFFKRCNARQRQTFFNVEEVYVFPIGSISIHGKESLRNFTFHQKKNRERSHLKTDLRHIWKVDSRTIRWDFRSDSIYWEDSSWKIIFGQWWRSHQSLACKGLCIFRFCVNQNSASNTVWEDKLTCFKDSPQNRTLDTIDGEPMDFEWNIFPGSTTLQLVDKVQEFIKFQGRLIFMSMFNDIKKGTTDNVQECMANAMLVSLFAQRFPGRRWSFLEPGSEKKCYSTYIDRPRREWDRVAEWMMIKFGESGHPVFRGTSPLSRGTLKSKGGGQLSIHFCADGYTIETVCRTIISVGQLSFWGTVSDLCDECKACQARTGRPVLARQSDTLFEPANSFN